MVRGARRPKSPFRATLEPLHELDIAWRPGRTGMGTLTDIQRGKALVQSPQVMDGQEVLAIASRLYQDGDPHGYLELGRSLHLLAGGSRPQNLLAAVWQLLDHAGWLGDLSHCWHCSEAVESSMFWKQGHLLCGGCGKGMEISAGLRKSIAAVLQGDRVMLSESNCRAWREMVRAVLKEHGIKATESFNV